MAEVARLVSSLPTARSRSRYRSFISWPSRSFAVRWASSWSFAWLMPASSARMASPWAFRSAWMSRQRRISAWVRAISSR